LKISTCMKILYQTTYDMFASYMNYTVTVVKARVQIGPLCHTSSTQSRTFGESIFPTYEVFIHMYWHYIPIKVAIVFLDTTEIKDRICMVKTRNNPHPQHTHTHTDSSQSIPQSHLIIRCYTTKSAGKAFSYRQLKYTV
jgi:hypothetical protein